VSRPAHGLSATLLAVHTGALLVALYLWIPMYRRLTTGPGGDHPGQGVVGKLLIVVKSSGTCSSF
jgi:hypothetical protein